jgi:glutamyl-tRNA reductase
MQDVIESGTMHSAVVGLSWKTASQEVRDRAYIAPELEHQLVERLRQQVGVDQVCVLSTCNRVELYIVDPVPEETIERVWQVWFEFCEMPSRDRECLYRHFHEDAVRHLFQVAASVDSLVQGETQISGQIRDARTRAQERCGDFFLLRLFQDALACSKRIRTTTTLGEGSVSIASTAVQFAQETLDLSRASVAIIGAGAMAEAAWRSFRHHGVKDFVYLNRTPEKLKSWACEVPGKVLALADLEGALECDVVLAAVRYPGYLIRPESLVRQDQLLLDISAPRVIDPECANRRRTCLVAIDDLQAVVDQNRQQRAGQAELATRLIEEDVDRFCHWLRSRSILDDIRQVREAAHETAIELARRHVRHLERLAGTPQFDEELEGFARLLANQLLHQPVHTAKDFAARGDEMHARRVLQIFSRAAE